MSTIRVVAMIAIAVASVARSTHAQMTSVTAKQLYEEGLTNYNLGHYEQALNSFEMGYRMKQDPAFLFNIGQCQRQLKQYENAERSYRAYLREVEGLPQSTRDQVQKLIAEMQKAIDDERAKMPPPGTQPPAEALSQTRAISAVTTAPVAKRQDRPVYKKGWFWAVVGGAVAVAAVGVSVAVVETRPHNPAIPAGAMTVTFP